MAGDGGGGGGLKDDYDMLASEAHLKFSSYMCFIAARKNQTRHNHCHISTETGVLLVSVLRHVA